MPGSRQPPEGSPFPTPELESVRARLDDEPGAAPPAEGSGSVRSRFGRTFMVLAVVGVLAVGTVLGTLGLRTGGDDEEGGGSPAPTQTETVPTPRSVDAELVESVEGRCLTDGGSRCEYGFYVRGDRTAAEQLGAIEDSLGPGYELTREFARVTVGDLRLRGGRGYEYTGPGGKTVTAYLRPRATAQRCNQNPALGCVDIVAFES